jgi:hypothetical protein
VGRRRGWPGSAMAGNDLRKHRPVTGPMTGPNDRVVNALNPFG